MASGDASSEPTTESMPVSAIQLVGRSTFGQEDRTPASVSPLFHESATYGSKTMPRLPTEVLQIVFDILDMSEQPLVKQRLWIRLSLVSKEWRMLILPYRGYLTFPTTESIQSFNDHAPAILASGMAVWHISFAPIHASLFEPRKNGLLQVMFYLHHTLRSISIPVDWLVSKRFCYLVMLALCPLEHLYVAGPATHALTFHLREEGHWWNWAKGLTYIDTLVSLTLSNLTVEGPSGTNNTADSRSTIRTLHLHDVLFNSEAVVTELALPLVKRVRHLVLTHLWPSEDYVLAPFKLCHMFCSTLRSLWIDRVSLNMRGIETILAKELFSCLPVLQSLELAGADCLDWRTHARNIPLFVELPGSFEFCALGQIAFGHACAFMQRMKDALYIPLFPFIRIELSPARRHCTFRRSKLIKLESANVSAMFLSNFIGSSKQTRGHVHSCELVSEACRLIKE